MFAIAAEFTIQPNRIDDFKKLIAWQAERSVAEEEGCVQFDVCQHQGKPDVFLLYEVYVDETAFDIGHVKTPRFEDFAAKAKAMLAKDFTVARMARFCTRAK